MSILANLTDEEIFSLAERNEHNSHTIIPAINELLLRGIYPVVLPELCDSTDVLTYSVRMAMTYGVRWHIYRGETECPKCQVDLRDHRYGPPFKRGISVYDRDRDITIGWRCPDCNYEWSRRK